MTREEVFDGLKEIIAAIRPNTDLTNVGFQTELVRELGIDSLTMLLLSLAAEEKFQMRFPDGAPVPATVGEVCDAVIKAKG
ncbi:MAG: acyl carrier protein [Bacteroidales bacterium]|nr:acyl carrier protein [Bacteroidales bacterium]